jgi:hypothetical protein
MPLNLTEVFLENFTHPKQMTVADLMNRSLRSWCHWDLSFCMRYGSVITKPFLGLFKFLNDNIWALCPGLDGSFDHASKESSSSSSSQAVEQMDQLTNQFADHVSALQYAGQQESRHLSGHVSEHSRYGQHVSGHVTKQHTLRHHLPGHVTKLHTGRHVSGHVSDQQLPETVAVLPWLSDGVKKRILSLALGETVSTNSIFGLKQCCGSGRFLTGSGSDFWQRPDPDPDSAPDPDPDPDPNKFSTNCFQKIFLMKICSKKYLSSWTKKFKNIDSLSIYGFYTHQKSW